MVRVKKNDLVDLVAERMRDEHHITITKNATEKTIDCLLAIIGETLAEGGSVNISNFGAFKLQKVKPRIGRNISTGEQVVIPATQRVKFTPGKQLKEMVPQPEE